MVVSSKQRGAQLSGQPVTGDLIWGFPKIMGTFLGYLFGGPNNKDYSIFVSILGSPHFGKLPYMF